MTRFLPIPDPAGSLQPPRRPPPTALATATPDPEPQRAPAVCQPMRGEFAMLLAVLGLMLPCVSVAQAIPEPTTNVQRAMTDAGTSLVFWTASEAGGSEQTVFLKNLADRDITITSWEIYECNNLAGGDCGARDKGPTVKPGKTARLVTVRRRESRGAYNYKYRFKARWTADSIPTSP